MRNILSQRRICRAHVPQALTLVFFMLLAASPASAFESRLYGEQNKKIRINPKSKINFPRAMEIYNIDLTPHHDNSALIRRLHGEGKRVICYLSVAVKPKTRAKNIESAMNAGCDEVAVR